MSVSAQVIVVTGASRGIGFELTKQSLELGHIVYAGARRPSLALELKELKDKFGVKLKIVDLDITSDASVVQMRAEIEEGHVDILINNAGVSLDGEETCANVSLLKVQDTMNVNFLGPIRVTQALMPLLKKSRQPRVVNITSQMGSIADNAKGGSLAYRASKAALNMFTKTLAIEQPEFIVLSLHPGWVKTRMGGDRAPVTPEASAEGLLRIIRGATLKESGNFFNYTAKQLPW